MVQAKASRDATIDLPAQKSFFPCTNIPDTRGPIAPQQLQREVNGRRSC